MTTKKLEPREQLGIDSIQAHFIMKMSKLMPKSELIRSSSQTQVLEGEPNH